MKVPYIIIKQKSEEFYVLRFSALLLRNMVNFHFREPYSNSIIEIQKYNEYLKKIEKMGIEISGDYEGVQRRIQIERIHKITNFLEKQSDSYFPNSVVLAADVSEEEKFVSEFLENTNKDDFGEVTLPESITFQIIDGQHRLLGLFCCSEEIQRDFEIFAVVLFNATKHTCAKVFRDINANQAPVNKSVIYDLLDLIKSDEKNAKSEQNLHVICKQFNSIKESPLLHHIKMLGVGTGAISQAFFIQYVKEALEQVNLDCSMDENLQYIFNNLFYYFTSFQKTFSDQWPVMDNSNSGLLFENNSFVKYLEEKNMDIKECCTEKLIEQYSEFVLRYKNSQLLKTNGFGAIMLLFPYVYKKIGGNGEFNDYYKIINTLKDKIDWCKDDNLMKGTGKKTQRNVMNKLRWKIMSQLELLVEIINELGNATYPEIYQQYEQKKAIKLTEGQRAGIRKCIEDHSSDSANYYSQNEDIFYSIEGIRKGKWGVRKNG